MKNEKNRRTDLWADRVVVTDGKRDVFGICAVQEPRTRRHCSRAGPVLR